MAERSKHISSSSDAALYVLKNDVLMMSSLTDRNFQTAIEALLNRDSELCNRVIADEEEVDILEKQVDQDGVNLLLRFHPVASDMREVISAMKISTNLERIADHAVTRSTDIQPKSITVTISGTLARELEEFRRIAMTTPDELVNDIVGEELGRDSDEIGGRKGDFRGSLGRYINRQNYSQEQANKVANSCNAFLLKETQRKGGRLSDEAAMVEPRANGAFRVWFPLRRTIRSQAAV
jgi:hypothetical protein